MKNATKMSQKACETIERHAQAGLLASAHAQREQNVRAREAGRMGGVATGVALSLFDWRTTSEKRELEYAPSWGFFGDLRERQMEWSWN